MPTPLAKAYVEIEARTAKLERDLKTVKSRFTKTRKHAQTQADHMGKAFRRVGVALAGAFSAAVITRSFGRAIKAAADFEYSMAKIATLLETNVSVQLGRLREQVRELAIEFGESTASLTTGLFDIISAGTKVSDSMKVARAAMMLAKAGQVPFAVAADALTTIMNSYKLSVDEAAGAAEWLFIVAKQGKTDVEKVAKSIGRVAPTAALAGVSLKDLGAQITVITRQGVNTNETMSALNAYIRLFLKVGDEARETARKYGVEMNTASIRGGKMLEVIKKLTAATDADIAKIGQEAEALRALAILVQNVAGYQNDLAKQTELTGIMAQKAGDQAGTSLAKWNKLKVIVKDLGVSIGELEGTKGTLDWLNQRFADLAKNIRDAESAARGFANFAWGGLGLGGQMMSKGQERLWEQYDALQKKMDRLRNAPQTFTTSRREQLDELERLNIQQRRVGLRLGGVTPKTAAKRRMTWPLLPTERRTQRAIAGFKKLRDLAAKPFEEMRERGAPYAEAEKIRQRTRDVGERFKPRMQEFELGILRAAGMTGEVRNREANIAHRRRLGQIESEHATELNALLKLRDDEKQIQSDLARDVVNNRIAELKRAKDAAVQMARELHVMELGNIREQAEARRQADQQRLFDRLADLQAQKASAMAELERLKKEPQSLTRLAYGVSVMGTNKAAQERTLERVAKATEAMAGVQNELKSAERMRYAPR